MLSNLKVVHIGRNKYVKLVTILQCLNIMLTNVTFCECLMAIWKYGLLEQLIKITGDDTLLSTPTNVKFLKYSSIMVIIMKMMFSK